MITVKYALVDFDGYLDGDAFEKNFKDWDSKIEYEASQRNHPSLNLKIIDVWGYNVL